jgi:hypothetical protein
MTPTIAVGILVLSAVVAAAWALVEREPRQPKMPTPQNVVDLTARRAGK